MQSISEWINLRSRWQFVFRVNKCSQVLIRLHPDMQLMCLNKFLHNPQHWLAHTYFIAIILDSLCIQFDICWSFFNQLNGELEVCSEQTRYRISWWYRMNLSALQAVVFIVRVYLTDPMKTCILMTSAERHEQRFP